MKRPLWKISVATTAEAEEAVTDLLSGVFDNAASSYTDVERRVTTVSVFCENRPLRLQARRAALRSGLQRIKSCGLNVGAGRIRFQTIPPENWAESWKRHFQPIEIGDALLVKPSWSKRRPRGCQAVVTLDPGLSFGTGQHPTTEFCLRQLARARAGGSAQSFLDIGTGSGILAIAAAKLGYQPIAAFDLDPEAVRIARANARANGVSSRIRITCADATKLPRRPVRRFDVVCANLISTLLIGECQTISSLMKPGGLLVLAGILKTEFEEIESAFASRGFHLVVGKTEKEWRSGAFCFSV